MIMISLKERFPQFYCWVVQIEVAVVSIHAQGEEEGHNLDDSKVEVVEDKDSTDNKDEVVVVVAEWMQRDFQVLTHFLDDFFIFF